MSALCDASNCQASTFSGNNYAKVGILTSFSKNDPESQQHGIINLKLTCRNRKIRWEMLENHAKLKTKFYLKLWHFLNFAYFSKLNPIWIKLSCNFFEGFSLRKFLFGYNSLFISEN